MVSSKEEETAPIEKAEDMTKQMINEKANQPTTMTSSTASVTTTILTTTTSMNTKTTSTLTTTAGEEIITSNKVEKEDSVAIPVTTERSIQPISIITTTQSVPTTTG